MLFGWDRMTRDDEDRLLRGVVRGGVHGGPWAIEIQPTNVCNVDCFFCSSKFHRAGQFLDWEGVLLPLLKDAAARDLKSVRLSGGGESLVYPKMRPLLGFLGEHGVRIADVTTNAAPLAKYADEMVAVGLDLANISINEPDAERYASTMKTKPRIFDHVLEGIRALRTAADREPEGSRPVIELKFMLWRENRHLLPRMVELGVELGADRIHLNNIIGLEKERRFAPSEIEETKETLTAVIEEDARRERPLLDVWMDDEPELQRHAFAERMRVMPGFAPEIERQEKRRTEYCLMGWYSMTIAATGLVFPCCNFVGLPDKVTGDIGRQSLAEIWEGADYEAFRREFRRLIVLEGNLEHTAKYDRFVEPVCIAHRECPWAWCLASGEFYGRLGEAVARETPQRVRLEAAARNLVLKGAHRVTSLAR